jgi:hypothetical protein
MVQTRDGEEEKLWEEFHELIGVRPICCSADLRFTDLVS